MTDNNPNRFCAIGVIFALFLICAPAVFGNEDADIIDVWGKNFGRLQLAIEVERKADQDTKEFQRIVGLIRKNVEWSGLFELNKNVVDSDLILTIVAPKESSYQVLINSQEGTPLYSSKKLLINAADREEAIVTMIEEIIYQLTGKQSILRSAIVFTQTKRGTGHRLVLLGPFGKKRKVLVDNGKINLLPRWKQDGSGVLYTTLDKKGSRIMQYDMKSGKVETLLSGYGNLSGGSWDHVRKALIVSLAKSGNSDLYRIDLKKRTKKKLTFRSSTESSPNLSPDGKRLLFVSNRSGKVQVYQKILKTGEVFRMTFDGSYNVEPAWSKDGSYIVYAGQKDGRFQLFIMDREGLWGRQLTYGNVSSEQPVWSPDGRQILYLSKVRSDQKLFIMRVDGTYKRRLTRSGRGVNEFNPSWTDQYKWPSDS